MSLSEFILVRKNTQKKVLKNRLKNSEKKKMKALVLSINPVAAQNQGTWER
jgi:hypothetical protein